MDKKGSIRRQHPSTFKARVALEAIKEQKTIAELSALFGIHSTQIVKWKKKALEGMFQVFSDKWKQEAQNQDVLIQELYQQIGKLKVERDWIKKKIGLIEDDLSYRNK